MYRSLKSMALIPLIVGALACSQNLGVTGSDSPEGVVPLTEWSSTLAIEVSYAVASSGGLTANIRANNLGNEPLVGRYSGCAWTFKAYSNASRNGEHLWSQNEGRRVCHAALLDLYIEPGDAADFAEGLGEVEEITRGTSADTLYMSASLTLIDPSGTTEEMAAGTVPIQ